MEKFSQDQVLSQIFQVARSLQHSIHKHDHTAPLPRGYWIALHLIEDHKAVLMKDIASHLFITPPSATVLINNLVKDGLVSRNVDKKDRRTIILKTTKKGKLALAQSNKRIRDKLKVLLKNLTLQEQITLFKLFKKMAQTN